MATKLVLIRSLQSAMVKIYILIGPTTLDVYHQMQELPLSSEIVTENKLTANSGVSPTFKYWHLGVHICNEHENNLTLAVADVGEVIRQKLPFDSHCIKDALFWLGDVHSELNNNNNLPPEVLPSIEELHNNDKKFVASVVPFPVIGTKGYQLAEEMNLLLHRNERTYVGQAFTKNISYIDYTMPEVSGKNQVMELLEFAIRVIENVPTDGIFVQGVWMMDQTMEAKIPNEPTEILPYIPDAMDIVMHKLPPWDIKSAQTGDISNNDLFLLKHNTFAAYLIERFCATSAANDKFCLSSSPLQTSNYPSLVAKTTSTWLNFAKQIHSVVTASLAGFKWVSFPVCGSDEFAPKHEELCIRWYQFSSLLPLFKVTASRFVHHFTKHGQKLLIDSIER